MELLIGCGSNPLKQIALPGQSMDWRKLVTLDNNKDHGPDVVADLMEFPYPFDDDTFDEIHAYEVLEHTGQQGDARFFFRQWTEFARIMKVGGLFFATCPSYKSMWAWGDPSHTRVITGGTLVFLDQDQYVAQVGKTAMSDFRYLYSASFKKVVCVQNDEVLQFVLRLESKGAKA
jgi:hypothetical protein